CQRYSDSPYSF
nr:immunoglobulin light chain junction region [Macaca mulatta]